MRMRKDEQVCKVQERTNREDMDGSLEAVKSGSTPRSGDDAIAAHEGGQRGGIGPEMSKLQGQCISLERKSSD